MKTSTEQKSIIRHDGSVLEQAVVGPAAAQAAPQAFQVNSAEFREAVLPQYAAPFPTDGWLHSGLND